MLPLLHFLMICAGIATQDNKAQDHKVKSQAVQVVEMKARRNDDVIEVTAEVKNSGEKPLKNLQVIFRFQNSAGDPISTEQMKIDEKQLMPGAEATLNVQLRDAPRATQIRIGAETGGGAELTVGESGPYPIE